MNAYGGLLLTFGVGDLTGLTKSENILQIIFQHKCENTFSCHENNSFLKLKEDDVLKKIKSLDVSRTSQNSDVPTKTIKRCGAFYRFHSFSVKRGSLGRKPSLMSKMG